MAPPSSQTKAVHVFSWLFCVMWSKPVTLMFFLVSFPALLLLCIRLINNFRAASSDSFNSSDDTDNHTEPRLTDLETRLDTLSDWFKDLKDGTEKAAKRFTELEDTVNIRLQDL